MTRLLPTAALLFATLAAGPACAWDGPPPAYGYGYGPGPGWNHRPPPPPRWGWAPPPPRRWAPPPQRYAGWDRPRYDRRQDRSDRGWNDGRRW